MLIDAKIVRADPEHPLATYEAGQEIEGPAAELQVALGHAQALPEPPAIAEVGERTYAAPTQPQEALGATEAPAEKASPTAPTEGPKGRR